MKAGSGIIIKIFARKFKFPVMPMLIVILFAIHFGVISWAQHKTVQNKKTPPQETFTRPKPTKPVKPEVPTANRYRTDKVFLEYADSLYKLPTRDSTEFQIVKGNVKFRQAGMWMYCDSAYYYPENNSLDAFGNVKMEQGDTLFVYADKLFYNGNSRIAYLKNGPSRDKVRLINKNVTLTTDSLDYDLVQDLGWYSRWGVIDDKVNTLTSLFGEYSPTTKNAEFITDVVLVNNRDGYTLLTDTLHYNTASHIARTESHTVIQSENDTIITTRAIYNTNDGNAELLSRSTILHRDSTGNIITLEGDSIVYNKAAHISKAYMFTDPRKRSMPMILTDTAQKMTLIGGFGIYNDSTREALATYYPLLMEYSQTDTLFMRADTIRTYIVTAMIEQKLPSWKIYGFPMYKGQASVRYIDGKVLLNPEIFALNIPLIDLPLKLLNQLFPRGARKQEAKDPEEMEESMAENSNNTSNDGEMPERSGLTEGMDESVTPKAFGETEVSDNEEIDKSQGGADSISKIPKEFHVAMGYHRARFFKQDIQGVADSIVFIEQDSMIYMFRKPIVWSGERQVAGNRIDVHFNDSTADWALLPESGMVSELVDEDFYNQMTGKTILAQFDDKNLKHIEVSGSVETIFLPQEEDSTYNRLVYAESSYLTGNFTDNKVDKLKMWPEVSGAVTPLFMLKRSQQYLQKFRWYGNLRPERQWYGDRVRWADNLGEVPDELEAYFLSPSEFGEPKTFSGTRFIAPKSSLPLNDDRPALIPEDEDITIEEIEQSGEELQDENRRIIREAEDIKKEVEDIESPSPVLNKDSIPERDLSEGDPPAEDELNPDDIQEETVLPDDMSDNMPKDEEVGEEPEDDEPTIVTLDDLKKESAEKNNQEEDE